MSDAMRAPGREEELAAMEEAFRALGVGDGLLSEDEREKLDADGVVVLEHHMDDALLAALRKRYDELTDHINLIDKGEVFASVLTDPKLLAGALHVLRRPFKLFAQNGRTAMPGGGSQRLHPDWHERVAPGSYWIVNSMWMLDDFTEENGSTRYVPGSHRTGRIPVDDMSDPMEPHPDERRLVGPAGSVAIINAHVWHSGTLNTTERPRRVVTCAFSAREHYPQQTVQRDVLAADFIASLSDAERWLLEVD